MILWVLQWLFYLKYLLSSPFPTPLMRNVSPNPTLRMVTIDYIHNDHNSWSLFHHRDHRRRHAFPKSRDSFQNCVLAHVPTPLRCKKAYFKNATPDQSLLDCQERNFCETFNSLTNPESATWSRFSFMLVLRDVHNRPKYAFPAIPLSPPLPHHQDITSTSFNPKESVTSSASPRLSSAVHDLPFSNTASPWTYRTYSISSLRYCRGAKNITFILTAT